MAIEIGTVNADTSVKLGTTTIQTGYIGVNKFFGNEIPILDIFPTAHHAFSLRKLRTAYTGFCLRVRRTTLTPTATTTTVDVSFNSLNTIGLDSSITYVSGTTTTAINLGQFCASIVQGYTNPDGVNTNQDIFISTWFDQSGNSKNVTSTTTTQQPRIVLGGNLETKNGKVAIRFINASSTRLILTDTSMNINNLSQYIVTSLITTTLNTITSAFRSSSNMWWLPASNTTNTYINYNTGPTVASGFLSQANDTINRLYSIVAPATTVNAYKNTTSIGTKASASFASQYIALGWSGVTGAPNALDGYIQESITWQNQLYVSPIQSNIITYYGI
jgi:hypothetical protein